MAPSNQNSLSELDAYVREHLEDMPEISELRWDGG
jgi:hypothetical protein